VQLRNLLRQLVLLARPGAEIPEYAELERPFLVRQLDRPIGSGLRGLPHGG
jgi:hypothetical protein